MLAKTPHGLFCVYSTLLRCWQATASGLVEQLTGTPTCSLLSTIKVHAQHSWFPVLIDCSCQGLRIKENKEVYEGEVTELTPEEAPSQTGGYGKVISHVAIGLKSVKGSKQLKLDPTIYDRHVRTPMRTPAAHHPGQLKDE